MFRESVYKSAVSVGLIALAGFFGCKGRCTTGCQQTQSYIHSHKGSFQPHDQYPLHTSPGFDPYMNNYGPGPNATPPPPAEPVPTETNPSAPPVPGHPTNYETNQSTDSESGDQPGLFRPFGGRVRQIIESVRFTAPQRSTSTPKPTSANQGILAERKPSRVRPTSKWQQMRQNSVEAPEPADVDETEPTLEELLASNPKTFALADYGEINASKHDLHSLTINPLSENRQPASRDYAKSHVIPKKQPIDSKPFDPARYQSDSNRYGRDLSGANHAATTEHQTVAGHSLGNSWGHTWDVPVGQYRKTTAGHVPVHKQPEYVETQYTDSYGPVPTRNRTNPNESIQRWPHAPQTSAAPPITHRSVLMSPTGSSIHSGPAMTTNRVAREQSYRVTDPRPITITPAPKHVSP